MVSVMSGFPSIARSHALAELGLDFQRPALHWPGGHSRFNLSGAQSFGKVAGGLQPLYDGFSIR
jgi:hypothetical protein